MTCGLWTLTYAGGNVLFTLLDLPKLAKNSTPQIRGRRRKFEPEMGNAERGENVTLLSFISLRDNSVTCNLIEFASFARKYIFIQRRGNIL